MYPFVLTIHIILSMLLIIIILMQPGKGADISSAFGGGGGGTQLFGASGPGTILTRGTGTIAFFFMVTSISLALMGTGGGGTAGDAVQDVLEDEEGSGFGNTPPKEAPSPTPPEAPVIEAIPAAPGLAPAAPAP